MSEYDYLIVGSGSAGGVIAARLAERTEAKIALLEAGGPATREEIAVPPAWPALLGSEVDWAFTTTPQPGTANRVLDLPRGRVLGGSSSINAMAHIRGHASDFDRWAEAGNEGWGYADVLPYFKRMEDCPGRDPRFRGTGGPLRPAPVASPNPVSAALIDAARELGHPASDDLNGADSEGAAWFDLLIGEGGRRSVAATYLSTAASQPNLTIVTGARALRLSLAGGRCSGVEYAHEGAVQTITASETIVCAGAIESPRLLLSSGIGPAEELAALDLTPVLDLEGVGGNLHDHLMVGVVYEAKQPLPAPTANLAESVVVSRSEPGVGSADLQHLLLQVPLGPPELAGPAAGYTIAAAHLTPASRGRLRLASPDPGEQPLIDPGFLREEADMETLVAAVRTARELGSAQPFEPWSAREVLPGPGARSDADLRRFVAAAAVSYFHIAGSCRMGVDELAVVDPRLRVRGLEGLRIADASVMPSVVSANTNAATMMIGEKAADLILEDV